MAELHPPLSLFGEVVGWGEEFSQGAHNPVLLSEVRCSVMSPGPSGSVDRSPYHSALAELAALDSHVAEGAQVCSRAKWVEEGGIFLVVLFLPRTEAWFR